MKFILKKTISFINRYYLVVTSMKIKLSIAVDEETLDIIQKHIKSKRFRNRSHAFEYSINQVLEGDKE